VNLQTPFASLSPDVVLNAVESLGLSVDGRLLALNSYENRVYRVGVDPGGIVPRLPQIAAHAVVVKFYRSRRWTDAQILEEHSFSLELAQAQLPVAIPLAVHNHTLHRMADHRFAVFECWPGTAPDLDLPEHRMRLGRTMGRLHARSRLQNFKARESLNQWQYGERARKQLLASGRIPQEYENRYAEVSARLVSAAAAALGVEGLGDAIRLHGDCHAGNILWNEQGPLFVDFDDCASGPAVQDLWMHCAGTPAQMQREWSQLLEGYEQFAHFDYRQVQMIEPLRAMRMMNHAAWLAARWDDPAFPRAFPWFGEPRFWERHMNELQEQCEAVEDPPLMRH
jgi:Ser/Thr protein kinase RdoA (MazF antagonist)